MSAKTDLSSYGINFERQKWYKSIILPLRFSLTEKQLETMFFAWLTMPITGIEQKTQIIQCMTGFLYLKQKCTDLLWKVADK